MHFCSALLVQNAKMRWARNHMSGAEEGVLQQLQILNDSKEGYER